MPSLHVSGVREEMLSMESDFETTLSCQTDTNWTPSHLRLLYLLSRFATYPNSTDEDEKWLRSLPLQVMVFEAIVHGLLAFDYSPVCTNIVKNGQSRRLWLNGSHDARAAIDDLREQELVHALKTCSEDFQPSTAYQVTQQGMKVLERLPLQDKLLFDDFLSSSATCVPTISRLRTLAPTVANPSGFILVDTSLLKITYNPVKGQFRIRRGDGNVYTSRVTDIEKVSYISTPYLPSCLTKNGIPTFTCPTKQAAKRYRKKAVNDGSNSARDANLSFAIVLENVRLLVGEWIPLGSNQIVLLNDRLGSLERCQGGLFTSRLDDTPTLTSLSMPPGLTKISIVDFDFHRFTNFEADVYQDSIDPVKTFGMHLNGDGFVVYGMEIDETMDRSADFLCVDHLARLLVDVSFNSSNVLNTLLSPHQRALLEMLFIDESCSRNKFALLTASGILPKLPARAYLDRGEKENELKQILGELYAVHDIGKDDQLLVGQDGILLVGPNAKKHEPLLVTHLGLLSRELVVRFFFKRTFILGDLLARARDYMTSYKRNPEVMEEMQEQINRCAHDLVFLEEILQLLRESLRSLAPTIPLRPSRADDDAAGEGAALYDRLQLRKTHNDLEMRCKDLGKLLHGFHAKLKQVQSQNSTITKLMLEGLVLGVERNMAVIAKSTLRNQRALTESFDILLILFASLLAFELLDRITDGDILGMDEDTAPSLAWMKEVIGGNLIGSPLLWFTIEMICLAIVIWLVQKGIQGASRSLVRTQRVIFAGPSRRMNVAAFEQFLRTPIVNSSENEHERGRRSHKRLIESCKSSARGSNRVVTVVWTEKMKRLKCKTWKEFLRRVCHDWEQFYAHSIRIQVTFDATYGLLLDIAIHAFLTSNCSKIYEELMHRMESAGCFDESSNTAPVSPKVKDLSLNSRLWRHFPRFKSRRSAPVHPT